MWPLAVSVKVDGQAAFRPQFSPPSNSLAKTAQPIRHQRAGFKHMRAITIGGALALALALPTLAQQASPSTPVSQSVVVANCGTPNTTYPAGQPMPDTQNTAGQKCIVTSGGGGGSSAPYAVTPLGYQQISAATLAASTALTVPTGSTFAVVQVDAANVRWRDDGTAPTAATGTQLYASSTSSTYITFSGAAELAAVRFILVSGSPILNISYYK